MNTLDGMVGFELAFICFKGSLLCENLKFSSLELCLSLQAMIFNSLEKIRLTISCV